MSEKKELTDKQKRFVEEYLIDRNGAQAALRAGYGSDAASARYSARDLLKIPEVNEAVQEGIKARSERTLIDGDYVLTVAAEMIERCRQAEPVMEWDPVAKEMVPTGEWKFEHAGVAKGLDIIMRLQNLGSPQKLDVNLKGDVNHNVKVTEMDLDARVKQLKGEAE